MAPRTATLLVLLLVIVGGCRCASKPKTPSVEMSDAALADALAGAVRVAAGDLDGDGRLELMAVDRERLRIVGPDGTTRATLPAPGAPQVLRIADVDGDGRPELLAGWGRSAARPGAKARIALYRLDGDRLVEQTLLEPTTERAQIVQILPMPGDRKAVLAAWFASKYDVSIARLPLERGATPVPVATVRMAMSIALGDVDGDGTQDLVIGRPYGDHQQAEGDAFVLREDGSRVAIPIRGGVSSLALADLDGDGTLEVLLGDGWDRDYGRLARALLTCARWADGAFTAELVEESEGQFVLWSIDAADLDGDGRPEVITRGPEQVRVVSMRDGRLQGRRIAGSCDDVAVVNLDGRGGDELLLLCGGRVEVHRGE